MDAALCHAQVEPEYYDSTDHGSSYHGSTYFGSTYRAQVEPEAKEALHQQWLDDETRVIVATSAFGTGTMWKGLGLGLGLGLAIVTSAFGMWRARPGLYAGRRGWLAKRLVGRSLGQA